MSSEQIFVRMASWRDCLFLWRLRNAPEVRQWMRATREFGLLSHVAWMWRVLRSDSVILMVACRHGRPVASVRIDRAPVKGRLFMEVSVSVRPEHQRQGLGSGILTLVSGMALHKSAAPKSTLIAVIRHDNSASMRCFLNAGFRMASFPTDEVALESFLPGDDWVLMVRP